MRVRRKTGEKHVSHPSICPLRMCVCLYGRVGEYLSSFSGKTTLVRVSFRSVKDSGLHLAARVEGLEVD